MKNVYIITKNSTAFNNEGIEKVLEIIKEKWNDTSDLTVCQGAYYNDRNVLIKKLKKHPDAYVFISTPKNLVSMRDDNIQTYVKNLEMNSEDTPYTCAVNSL